MGDGLPPGIWELMSTSTFLRALTAAGQFKRPSRVGEGVWNAPREGFFGAPWDEDTRPAKSISDLHDYIGGAVPAVLWYSYYVRTPTAQPRFPHTRSLSLQGHEG